MCWENEALPLHLLNWAWKKKNQLIKRSLRFPVLLPAWKVCRRCCISSIPKGLSAFSSFFSPSTLAILQFSRNVRMLISLPCVFRLVHVAVPDGICLCVCTCVRVHAEGWIRLHVRECVCLCQCALIQYSNTPLVLLHQGNIKSSSTTTSRCFANCSGLHRLRTGLNHQAREGDSLQNCQVNSNPQHRILRLLPPTRLDI